MEEKNEVKTLKEKLFTRREHGAKVLSKEEMKNSQDFSVGYKDFLNKSKTESEAVAYVLEKAKKFGFEKFEMGKSYKPGDKIFAVNRGKNIALCVIGDFTLHGTPKPNKSPEPTAVGAASSAVAVHVAGRRWLSFLRSAD